VARMTLGSNVVNNNQQQMVAAVTKLPVKTEKKPAESSNSAVIS
jgi:hypothetical protein